MNLRLKDVTSRTEYLIIRATQVGAIASTILLLLFLPGCEWRFDKEKIAKLEGEVQMLRERVAEFRAAKDDLVEKLADAKRIAELTGSETAVKFVEKIEEAIPVVDDALAKAEGALQTTETALEQAQAGVPWWKIAIGAVMGAGDLAAVFLGPKALVAWRAARGAMQGFNRLKTVVDSGKPIDLLPDETPKDARKRITAESVNDVDSDAIDALRKKLSLA